MSSRRTRTREVAAIFRVRTATSGTEFYSRRLRLVMIPQVRGPFVEIEEIGPLELASGEQRPARLERCQDVQTLTYLLDGEWESAGRSGGRVHLAPGDAYWLTARKSIVRREGPATSLLARGGFLHCIEVTMRLASPRMTPESSRVVRACEIPEVGDAARARVMAGALLATPGAFDPKGPIVIADWSIQAGAAIGIPIAFRHEVLLYAYRDVVWIGADGLALREGQLALLGPGTEVVLRGPERSLRAARVLLLAGPPGSMKRAL